MAVGPLTGDTITYAGDARRVGDVDKKKIEGKWTVMENYPGKFLVVAQFGDEELADHYVIEYADYTPTRADM